MRRLFRAAGICLLLLFIILSLRSFEAELFWKSVQELLRKPLQLGSMLLLYGAAFVLRAYAWKWYLQGRISSMLGLYGLLYSLLVNHISPFKIGDAVRIAVITRNQQVPLADAAQSVIVLRLLDLLVLALFGAAGTFLLLGRLVWQPLLFLSGAGGAVLLLFMGRNRLPDNLQLLREALSGWRGSAIFLAVLLSWVCEAFVIYQIVPDLSFGEALWVNSVTIAGQIFQLTPGGLGTYETVMTFALQAVGAGEAEAYTWALMSHGFKFFFSYAAGAVVLLVYPMQLTPFLRRKKEGEFRLWRK